jgi:hypothetical protein
MKKSSQLFKTSSLVFYLPVQLPSNTHRNSCFSSMYANWDGEQIQSEFLG